MLQALASSATARAEAIGRDAARHADGVDREARFPAEAMAAIKAQRLLGLTVPRGDGGEGAGLHEAAAVCSTLGRHCASSAMILAMHLIKVQSLLAGAGADPWHRAFLRRIAQEQLLLASATTERATGGDIASSACAVERKGARIALRKDATVVSYGRQADAILITARRAPDAQASDQVLLVALKEQCRLEPRETWDALGMRGTCSEGFLVTFEGAAEQVCPVPFAEIAAQSMLATSHILWSSVWHGIAADAVARAQAFVRAQARQSPGAVPVGAVRLAEAGERLQLMRGAIVGAIDAHLQAQESPEGADAARFDVTMNNLKVTASQLLVEIVGKAMLVCGIAGYRNDTPFSLGRHLRDAHSAPLMINNDRIERNVAGMLLVSRLDGGLTG